MNMTTSAKQLKVSYVVYGLLVGSEFFLSQGTELYSDYMRYHLNLLTEQKIIGFIEK